MKIIQFLKNKAGKWSLSAMQAVGLSAAVGVAGIAAWQMMGSSSQPNLNTVFSSNAADQDVVFVAGAAGGVYGSGSYGEGGEIHSGIKTTLSKDLQLMQADAQSAQQIAEGAAFVQQEQNISAYKMDGASGGLGMGGNVAKEMGGAMSGDMSAVQKQIADIQASIAAQKQAAEAAATADGAGNAAKVAAAMKGQGGGQFGMAEGMARASGNNLNSTPLQSGQYAREGQGVSSSGVLGGAQAAVPSALGAATQVAKFDGSRGSVIGQGNRMRGDNSLETLQKQSVEISRHSNRSANEGARAFMASTRLSGGIRLDGGEALAGGAASSSDFTDDAISALGDSLNQTGEEVVTYEEAKEELRRDLREFVKKCNTWSWIWGINVAGYLAQLRARKKMLNKVESFRDSWGESDYETKNTVGSFANLSESVVRTAFRNIAIPGGPKDFTERFSVRYWGVPGAFSDKNWTQPTEEEKEEFRNSVWGKTFYEGDLKSHYGE